MITGSENTLNAKNIFKKISEYDIYRHYLGYDFTPKKPLISPFRTETTGSFNIYFNRSGYLRHYDFGNSYYKGNCFNFVQQLYGLDFHNALKKISYDFNLGLGNVKNNSNIDYGSIIKSYRDSKSLLMEGSDGETKSERVTIHVQSRSFTKEELDYWRKYGIEEHTLSLNNIYSIEKLYINGKYIGNYKGELRFAYMFESLGEYYFKIYQPYSINYKWISNVPVRQAMAFEKLPLLSNSIIIAKSKKDKLIIQKIHTDVYEVQKEGIECIPPELDSFFDEYYDYKYCFYDNDEAGMNASIAMNSLGYKWINIPNEYKELGIKDPGDLLEYFGVEEGMRLLDIIIKRKLYES